MHWYFFNKSIADFFEAFLDERIAREISIGSICKDLFVPRP